MTTRNEPPRGRVFNTPFGRYRFKRLPFGIHVASEIFQQEMEQILEGIDGVVNVQDDILIYASNKEQHDQRLAEVMERIKKSGIKLNKKKCEIGRNDLIFLGHRVTSTGIKPDPSKIEAIKQMKLPTTVTELQRFMGMVNYVAKFIPNLAELTTPLRKLLQKDTEFCMNKEHRY